MEGVADIIMSLCDTSTNAASGGVSTSIVAMSHAADGAVSSCVVADTRRPFNMGKAETPA